MNDKDSLIPIGKAAEILGVSIMTLRRWDASGKFSAVKSIGGHRYYTRESLNNLSTDIWSIAQIWAGSIVAPDLDENMYSDTQDRFRARLERMALDMDQNSSTKKLAPLVTAVAGEIGNNSFDHNLGNWPDIPGVLFAYDLDKRVVILADRGVGIKETILRIRPDITSDVEALTIAMTERVSGRMPERRGNGLKFVTKASIESSIDTIIQSGTALADITGNLPKKLQIILAKNNIRGVLTRIEF